MKSRKINDSGPKIAVINIDPSSIRNCIKNTVHGVKVGSVMVRIAEKLELGTICIIRQISSLSKFKTGVIGIWYYYDRSDIEGGTEPIWRPSTGWKYKLFMKPLIKQFRTPFFEEFFGGAPEQPEIKKSLKVYDLLNIDIKGDTQGAITMDFRDVELPKRYLKAIIEEKRVECNIRADYKDFNENETNINIYELLDDLVGAISYLKPDRGEESRRAPPPKARRRSPRTSPKVRKGSPKTYSKIQNRVEVDDIETLEITGARIAFCPTCEMLLRPKVTRGGVSVLFCKECNIGYKITPNESN